MGDGEHQRSVRACSEDLPRWHRQFEEAWRGILHPVQRRRFEQLQLRAEGWHTVQLPSVVAQLNLTEAQQKRYEQFMDGIKQQMPKSLAELSLAEYRWNQTVLTDAQRKKMREILGEPFDFSRVRIPEVKAPEMRDVETWINSPPLTLAALKGKVVVFNFWTFGCIYWWYGELNWQGAHRERQVREKILQLLAEKVL